MIKQSNPTRGSGNQTLWWEGLEGMGGQFWPLDLEESDMPQVGAKYPMMLYAEGRECIVHDDEEFKEAKTNGFNEHPSLQAAAKPEVKPEVKPEELPVSEPPPLVTEPSKPAQTTAKSGQGKDK